MRYLVLISLIMGLSKASWSQSPRETIEALLPKELVESLGQPAEEAEKKFKSKIKKKDSSNFYLNYFGINGDTTLGIREKKIGYIYLEPSEEIKKKDPNLFSKAMSWPSPEEKKAMEKRAAADHSHEKGRYILIQLPKESMTLEFTNNEKKTLRSILLWKRGEVAP